MSATARGETPVPQSASEPAGENGDADAAVSRAVSPSGRIARRPSVIVQDGTNVERIAAPPNRPPTGEMQARSPSAGTTSAPRPASGGPPMLLIVAAAAAIGAALTVTVYRQYYRRPQVTPPPTAAPAVVQSPPERVNLTFESEPPGARVLRDGVEELGVTPFVFAVDPQGPLRRYVFRLADHHDAATEVAPGKTHERVRVIMRPLSPPPPRTEPTPAGVGTSDAPPADAKTGAKAPRTNTKAPGRAATPELASAEEPAGEPEQKPGELAVDDGDLGELKDPFRKKSQ